MAILNGQPVDAPNSNAAFVSRLVDTNAVGRIDLENVLAASGASVFNIQKALNAISSFSGVDLAGTFDQKPTWNNNQYGNPADSTKDRADTLTQSIANLQSAIDLLPQWRTYNINFSAITDPGTSFQASPFIIQDKEVIHKVILRLKTQFASPLLTAFDIKVGVASDTALFVPAFDGLQTVDGEAFYLASYDHLPPFGSTENFIVDFTITDDTLDQLTAGEIDVHVFKSIIP